MTFPQGYNSKKLDEYDLNVRHVKAENYSIGITTLLSPMGNEIRVYNLERSLCDILRGSGSNVELINSAMRRYANSKNKNVPQLLQYATAKNISPQLAMQNDMLERILARIEKSPYRSNFILKGGFLIAAIVGIDSRTTMDLDTTIIGFNLTAKKPVGHLKRLWNS